MENMKDFNVTGLAGCMCFRANVSNYFVAFDI